MSTGILKKPSVRLQKLKIENIYQVVLKKIVVNMLNGQRMYTRQNETHMFKMSSGRYTASYKCL